MCVCTARVYQMTGSDLSDPRHPMLCYASSCRVPPLHPCVIDCEKNTIWAKTSTQHALRDVNVERRRLAGTHKGDQPLAVREHNRTCSVSTNGSVDATW